MEDLKHVLLAMRTTKDVFSFPLDKEKALVLLKAAYMAEVEYRHRVFDDDGKTNANLRKVAEVLTGGGRFGMIMLGGCGNGKTTMIHALQQTMNYLRRKGYLDDSECTGLRVIDAKEVFRKTKDMISDPFCNAPMLAIEDIGREAKEVLEYGNVINPVADLIEYRYERLLYTILTTNMTPEEVRERYGARIADRLNEMAVPIIFKGGSYR